MYSINCTPDDVVILDSCSDEKISYHLVFKSVVFANNKKCKSFIQYVIGNLTLEELEILTVFDKNGEKKLIIDMSVYNKNQNFREVIIRSKVWEVRKFIFKFLRSSSMEVVFHWGHLQFKTLSVSVPFLMMTSLRLMYSSKFGKQTPFKPVKKDVVNIDQRSLFFDSLICDKSLLGKMSKTSN